MSTHPLDLSAIVPRYDVFLVDVWGVVHDGRALYPGVAEALQFMQTLGKRVVFFSNNPRPAISLRNALLRFNVPEPFEVMTSGEATRTHLLEMAPVKVLFLGENREIVKDVDSASLVDTWQEADVVVVTLLAQDLAEWAPLEPLIKPLARSGKRILCANPDKMGMNGTSLHYCAGAFCEKLRQAGGNVVDMGKPALNFYQGFAQRHLQGQDLSRVLMIGDTLETDGEGAARFGIDFLLVLSGNSGREFAAYQAGLPEGTLESFLESRGGVTPHYVLPRLALS